MRNAWAWCTELCMYVIVLLPLLTGTSFAKQGKARREPKKNTHTQQTRCSWTNPDDPCADVQLSTLNMSVFHDALPSPRTPKTYALTHSRYRSRSHTACRSQGFVYLLACVIRGYSHVSIEELPEKKNTHTHAQDTRELSKNPSRSKRLRPVRIAQPPSLAPFWGRMGEKRTTRYVRAFPLVFHSLEKACSGAYSFALPFSLMLSSGKLCLDGCSWRFGALWTEHARWHTASQAGRSESIPS